jgi:hypothetical protein
MRRIKIGAKRQSPGGNFRRAGYVAGDAKAKK